MNMVFDRIVGYKQDLLDLLIAFPLQDQVQNLLFPCGDLEFLAELFHGILTPQFLFNFDDPLFI